MLSEQSQAIYELLVARPGVKTATVSEELGLSLREIEGSLQELIESQLVTSADAESTDLRALSPDVAIASLVGADERKITELHMRVSEQRRRIGELHSVYNRARKDATSSTGYEVIDSPERVVELIFELTRRASSLIFETHPGHGMNADIQEDSIEIDRGLRERKVLRKTILDESTRSHAPTIRAVKSLEQLGCQYRTAVEIPVRMFIFDQNSAIVSRDAHPNDKTALHVTDPVLTHLLTQSFLAQWNVASPFSTIDDEENEVSPLQISILRLLANGYSDATVARRLSLSLRTYRRQVATLMEALQAESRFQAGVIAARRGILK